MNVNVIDVKKLRKSFAGKVAVYDFSTTIKSGEIIGFLGPNGSGKTTIIRMLCGLLSPDSGQGTCLGFDLLTQGDLIRKRVGYMTQRFSLYGYLTILENFQFIARAFQVDSPTKRIDEIVQRLDLGERLYQQTKTLSGGWKQKVALGAALIHQPKLLLLDEPTAGVDPEARRDFWKIINDISAEGVTVLVSTHYMDEAERCHRIIYLAYGNLIVQGSIQEIIKNANLSSWQVSGEHIHDLEIELEKLQGIDQVIPFGVNLHVLGKDKRLMLKTLHSYFVDLRYHWRGIDPTLEDVFINLISELKEKRFD